MKDQVDNLAERGITEAVTINGMLDAITRALAIEKVQDGTAALLYISPEMLRSATIERILFARNVVRFVIDEAHCFSSWGQDFRVDYLYIGHFIRKYQQKKGCKLPIPVSCFTATAKQKVIQDIRDYFKQTLDLNLELFASKATRTNLRYSVLHVDNDEEKYQRLRELVADSQCPTIVYVSRTRRTRELASRLTHDGFRALPFNGKMDSDEKITNQEAFMNDQVRIIVATSAFGMGVDKSDVGLVVHYDISDSLENYVQEAGRAGRNPHLHARCFVLYGDNDLDKHFILLNQTKLSIGEIQQVWKAVKELTRQRMQVNSSALEIARQAGWDGSGSDIETRVRTALAALEQAGYLERGQQRSPRLRHGHHRAESRRSPATTDGLATVRQQGDRTGGPHHQVTHLEKVYCQSAGIGGRIANRLSGRHSGHEQARGDLRRGAHAPGGDPGRQQGSVGLPARNGRFGTQVATAARALYPARTLPAPPHPGGRGSASPASS